MPVTTDALSRIRAPDGVTVVQPVASLVAALIEGRTLEARVLAVLATGAGGDVLRLATSLGMLEAALASDAPVPAPGTAVRLSGEATEAGGVVLRMTFPAPEPATAVGPAESPEIAAVRQAAADAIVRQHGMVPALAYAADLAAASDVPAPVRQAAARVAATRLSLDAPPTPAAVAGAVARSGLFLEARLAMGQAPTGDLKAALLSLNAALAQAIGQGADEPAKMPAMQPPAMARSPGVQSTVAAVGADDVPAQVRAPAVPVPSAPPPPGVSSGERLVTPVPHAPAIDVSMDLVDGEPAQRSMPARSANPGTALPSRPPFMQSVETPDGNGTSTAPGLRWPAAAVAAGNADADVAEPPRLAVAPPNDIGTGAFPVRADQPLPLAALPAAVPLLRSVLLGLQEAADLPTMPHDKPPASAAAPPIRGGWPHPEAAMAGGGGTLSGAGLMRAAQGETDAAIARLVLDQYASLPTDQSDPVARSIEGQRLDAPRPERQSTFEIPVQIGPQTASLRFHVERDGGRQGGGAAPVPAWRLRLAFDIEPLGPIRAQVGLVGGRVAIGLWADRPATVAALGAEAPELRVALTAADFEVDVIHLAQGAPPENAPIPEGAFVERMA